jgi:hypothetical protein
MAMISVTCESCANIFHVKPARMRAHKPRFCSMDCRKHSNDPARFWEIVEKRDPDDCWPLRASHAQRRGVLFDGEYFHAHSVAFRLTHSRWPEGGRQSCGNRRCANPAHVIDGRAE